MTSKIITASLAILLCAIGSKNVFAQTTNNMGSTLEASKEKKETTTKIKIRNTVSNSLDTEDGIPLIETTNNYFETSVTVQSGKTTYFGNTGFGTTTDRYDTIGKFTIGAQRQFKGADVTLQGTSFFSHHYKFGDLRVEVSRSFKLSEHSRIRPFTNVSYFLPLESGRSNVRRGWVSRTGFQYQTEFNRIDFDTKVQLSFDTGAVIEGRRTGINCESEILFPLPRTNGKFKLGPKFGFLYFPRFDQVNHEMKSKSFNVGVVFSVF